MSVTGAVHAGRTADTVRVHVVTRTVEVRAGWTEQRGRRANRAIRTGRADVTYSEKNV